jgi:hypothetical protein
MSVLGITGRGGLRGCRCVEEVVGETLGSNTFGRDIHWTMTPIGTRFLVADQRRESVPNHETRCLTSTYVPFARSFHRDPERIAHWLHCSYGHDNRRTGFSRGFIRTLPSCSYKHSTRYLNT